jgi:hypothetical protein
MIHTSMTTLTVLARKLFQGTQQVRMWWTSLPPEEQERYLALVRNSLERGRSTLERRLGPGAVARYEHFLSWARTADQGGAIAEPSSPGTTPGA